MIPLRSGSPRRLAIPVVGLVFAMALLFATLRLTSTPLHLSENDRALSREVCESSIRAQLPDARFPLAPSIQSRTGGRLRLSGSVDSGSRGQAVRRNYSCLLRRDSGGAYIADSVEVWQSH